MGDPPVIPQALSEPAAVNQTDAQLPMASWVRIGLGAYIVCLLLMLLFLLARLWPVSKAAFETTDFPWGAYTFPIEVRYMLIAACAGAVGAYIHLATSFADYAGNRKLAASWAWWYVLRPCIGASLSEVVYLTVRGGFIGTGNGSDINPSGIAAICALCGLFSKQATDKLREVFETLFRTHEKVERADALVPQPGTKNPPGGAAGDGKAGAATAGR